MHFVFFPFSGFSFVAFSFSTLILLVWSSHLTCKIRLPCNLYCVGGDVKPCTIQSNPIQVSSKDVNIVPRIM